MGEVFQHLLEVARLENELVLLQRKLAEERLLLQDARRGPTALYVDELTDPMSIHEQLEKDMELIQLQTKSDIDFQKRRDEIRDANLKDQDWQHVLHGAPEPDWDALGEEKLSKVDLYVCPFCFGKVASLVTKKPLDCECDDDADCLALAKVFDEFNPILLFQRYLDVRNNRHVISSFLFRLKREWMDHISKEHYWYGCDEESLKQDGFFAETSTIRSIIRNWEKWIGSNQGTFSWLHLKAEEKDLYNLLVKDVEIRQVSPECCFKLWMDDPDTLSINSDSDTEDDFINDDEEADDPNLYRQLEMKRELEKEDDFIHVHKRLKRNK